MTAPPPIKISPAEGVVMEALWRDAPQGSEELGARLGPANGWGEETVRTLLRRLLAKGAVSKAPEGRRVLYSPILKREDYVRAEGRGLIDRLFGGSLANLVHQFGATEKLNPQELEALHTLVRKSRLTMLDPILPILIGADGVLGAVLAKLRGATCSSGEGRVGDLRRRLSGLPRRAQPARRAAGLALLAGLLTSGALTAYAAEPSRPDTQTVTQPATAGGATATVNAPTNAIAEAEAAADTALAEFNRATAAAKAATPDTRPALEAAANAAMRPVVMAFNNVVQAYTLNNAQRARQGLPLLPIPSFPPISQPFPPPVLVPAVPTSAMIEAQAVVAKAQAESDRANAAAREATTGPRVALDYAANLARVALINAQNAFLNAQTNAVRAEQGLPPLPPPAPRQPPPPPPGLQ